MKDYTEIFSKAIRYRSGYHAEKIGKIINAQEEFHFGDFDEWIKEHWYLLSAKKIASYDDYYGYLSSEYPVALLSEKCPYRLKQILNENRIFYTELIEPLSCDEAVLKQFVHHKKVFDEHFLDDGNFSFEDERFALVLERLESGFQRYVDASHFLFREIR